MKKIKLKEKIYAILGALLLLAISVSAVHTITDDYVIYEPQTTTPTGTTEGTIYYNDTDNIFYGLCGATWKSLNESGGSSYSAGAGVNLSGTTFSFNTTWGREHFVNETFIRNSNGNYWTATANNIQQAIWDLNGTDGGTVWLPGDTTIDVGSTITLEENVALKGAGTKLNISADVNGIEPKAYTEISGIEFSVEWRESTGVNYTKSCIFVDGDFSSGINTRKSLYVHNCEFTANTGGWTGYVLGNAIQLFSDSAGNVYTAFFDNIWIRNFWNGIYLNRSTAGSLNSNVFTNTHYHNCVYSINLTTDGVVNVAMNQFIGFSIQGTSSWSEEGIHVEGRHNQFYGIVADVSLFKKHAVNFTSEAEHTILMTNCVYSDATLVDHGTYNMVGATTFSAYILRADYAVETGDINKQSSDHLHIFNGVPSDRDIYVWSSGGVRLQIDVTDTYTNLKYPMNATGAVLTFEDQKIVTITDILKLAGRTTDPSPLSDGMLWYNTTADWFYCRAGGATYTFNLTAV